MSRIAGVTVHRNKTGRVNKITLTSRRWKHLIEDVLDRITVEKNKDKKETDWELVKQKLDKKHGIKK
jgi:hypothetical protein